MGYSRTILTAGHGQPRRFRLTILAMLLLLSGVALLLGFTVPVYRHVARWREHDRLNRYAQAKIMSLAAIPPAEVPADQWQRAVEWTSNLICQAYFAPEDSDPSSLKRLCDSLDDKLKGQVDLATLRWVWDEVERAPRSGAEYAIRFRDVRILTKEPITDDNLPHLWSLHKCLDLDLDNTQVTDAGLKHLEGLSNLGFLSLRNTQVTDAGASRLQEKLPACRISR